MKNKVIITIVVIMICLIGSTLCFIAYGSKLRNNKPNKTEPITFNDKDFNVRMFKTSYATSEGNYLISPYSIYVALSMLRDGGNNNTSKEVSELIGTDKAQLLNNESVHIANAIFLKDEYKDAVENSYVDGLKNNYKAQLLIDKFDTPAVINNWVDKETSGMIKKVMDDIDKDFVLGLANAIAIDVKWEQQFMCGVTRSQEFTKKDGSKKNVEMMHNTYEYGANYIESDKAKGIIIPYKEETNLEYIAIKPNDNLNDYINNFSMDELSKLEENKKSAGNSLHINLALPRYTYDFELKSFMKNLQSMGINDAFSKYDADFTNIITRANMDKYNMANLYVNQAIHKSHIELNEAGTKAAAVTFFGFAKATAVQEPHYDTINIEFDKSFMYIIRDKNTKEILFIGVVDEPNEWKGSTCEEE